MERPYVISTDPARLDLDFIARTLDTTYWAKGRPRATIAEGVAASLCFGAYATDGVQVGFARVATDRATFAWVCDVIVDPPHQGRGVGKQLMEAIVSHPDLRRCSMLLATRDAHGLYEKYEFKPIGMMRRAPAEGPRSTTFQPTIPASIVQRQLDAFNAKDLAGLLETYAVDAEFFEHPGKLVATGHDQLRARFAARFQEPDLRATLRQRIVSGSTVVDHEVVTRNLPQGRRDMELVMIFEVRDGKIHRATAIAGATG